MINIDKNAIYESHGYKFKNFVLMSLEEKQMVLEWRNTPSVRKWMYNSESIELRDHLSFIENLCQREDRYYWLVISPSGNNIGVFDIISVDQKKDIAEMGYYLNPSPEYMGEGLAFVKECHYFFFHTLSIKNIYGAVNKQNINAYLLAKYLGASFSKDEDDKYYITHYYDKELFRDRYSASISHYVTFCKKERTNDNSLR